MESHSWSRRCWKLGIVSSLALGGASITSFGDHTFAQITPDSTLGADEQSLVRTNVRINSLPSERIDGGAIRGANLFHSFREFNVGEARGVYFTNPAGIENILSRVTGSSPSNILGTLGVLGNANLFLLNPNGIVFGPNASLDVGGSFVATTANAIQFGDQGFFSASTENVPPLLTVNPSTFLFNQITAQSITNQSRAGLQVSAGKSLFLLGGNVSLDGGSVRAPGGQVELGGAAGVGTVGLSVDSNNLSLSFPNELARADVSLTNGAFVDVAAGGGGSIVVNARNLDILGRSGFVAGIGPGLGEAGSQAGDITLNVTGTTIVTNSDIFNEVGPGAEGKGGDLSIKTQSLSLTRGSRVGARAGGQGDAGNVTINARSNISLDGVGSAVASRVESEAMGNGGSIDITTGSLSVTNGAVVSASTFGRGNAGEVTIDARNSISFDGVGSNGLPSAAASRVESRAVGNGGSIDIMAGSLSVTNGAVISARTIGQGDAGRITIDTRDSVALDGVNPSRSTTFGTAFGSGIFSTVEEVAVGNGGSIDIMAGSLSVTNGALVSTASTGQGDAGNVKANVRSLQLDNQGALEAETASGNGGNITLRPVGDLQLRRNSRISTNARGTGTGGNITIDTDTLVALENSDISANAVGGSGGQAIINAQGVFGTAGRQRLTPESDITATSELGPQFEGVVEINTPDVDLQSALTQLSANFISPEQVVAGSCLARRNAERGSFTVTGTGGLPHSPYEAVSSHYSVTGVQPIQGSGNVSKGTEVVEAPSWKPGDPVQEAQGIVVTAAGRTIVGTAPQLVAVAKAQDLVCQLK